MQSKRSPQQRRGRVQSRPAENATTRQNSRRGKRALAGSGCPLGRIGESFQPSWSEPSTEGRGLSGYFPVSTARRRGRLQEAVHNSDEFFWAFFIGKMACAFDDGKLGGLEIAAQRFCRGGIHGPVLAAPDQQGGDVPKLRQNGLKVPHVLLPGADDLYSMFQGALPPERGRISTIDFRGDAARISPHPAQEKVVKGPHRASHNGEEHGWYPVS